MMKKSFLMVGIIQLAACCLLIACNSKQPVEEVKLPQSRIEKIKIVEIPASKMISSGNFSWGNDVFSRLMKLLDNHMDIFPRDFVAYNHKENRFIYYISVMNQDINSIQTDGFEIINFEGGLYAVATAIDTDDNPMSLRYVQMEIEHWVYQSDSFELDLDNRFRLTQMPLADNDEFKKAMGYYQLDVFVPIKVKK